MLAFLMSALLTVAPVSLSENALPSDPSLSDNSVIESVQDPEAAPEEPEVETKEEKEIEYIYVPVEVPSSSGNVEESGNKEGDDNQSENPETFEILVSVSDNSVSDNSVSGNDILPISESLMKIEKSMAVLLTSIEPTVSAYQVSEYYREYFKGILLNMPHTDYLCYADRVYTGNQFITHYYLMYDLKFENGTVVPGYYPCFDVYSDSGIYYVDEIDKRFDGFPTFGYASFSPYSALIDRSFHYNDLYIGLICVFVFFVIGRKTVLS